ncbi:MAG: S41 family peptidase [Saprospiraceae bacterium]|nr:S41 family peptidase [Saprospiraceae bacterium]
MKKTYIRILAGLAFLILLTAASPVSNRFFEIAKNIEIFSNVYKEINSHYVDDLEPSRMMKIGIDAMLGALDPYTRYISEADVENFRLATEGKYEGIGAKILQYGGKLVVNDVYNNSPAEKAGLKIADEVLAVNGQSATGKDGGKVMRFLRGAPGTEVDIKVKSPGSDETRTVTLVREEISLPSVPYSGIVEDSFAYVSLRAFTPGCGGEVSRAFEKLDGDNEVRGFILDLRNNGGGLLSEAVHLCNLFLPKSTPVVSTKGKVKARDRSYSTLQEPFDEERPLVVLINNNSASASEIVSGTIQDYDRGVLMGQQSFGKGLVQNTKEVGYNSRVKITTAKYFIPSGRCIQAVEYEDGEPVDLPDSLRAEYTTENGRVVLDGGGVGPDIRLKSLEDHEVLKFIEKEGIIFNYVTDYLLANPIEDITADYSFKDYADFRRYFAENRRNYKSPVEKKVNEFKKKAQKDGLGPVLNSEIQAIESKLSDYELKELDVFRERILYLINTEIVKRYELDSGRMSYMVSHDPEVLEAAQLLRDEERYNDILKISK